MDYLPKDATIEEACHWLQAKTGQTWVLPRLLECHLTPHFWLDYKPGYPAIFGNRIEGFQTRMIFQGDLCRLESDRNDALVNMFAAHDGSLIKVEPGLRVPLSELKFKREELESVAEIINLALPATSSNGAGSEVTETREQRQDRRLKACITAGLTMNDKTFPYWLAVEESKTVCFSDLAHMMAKAMHPGDHELMSYTAARINLEGELKQAVRDGVLTPRNAAGLGRHTFPHGDALQRAVFIPRQDLEPFLNDRGIELRLTPHGSGPDYWTLENAAAALQEQLNWHDGARAELQDQMQEAATTGALAILDPHTCLPTRSKQVHTYWELVTPASVNNWLERQGVPYRWRLTPPEVELESNEASNTANNSEAFPWPKVMHGQRVWRLSKAIDEIARALNWHQSQRDRLMAQAVKAGTAGVLVLRDLFAGGITKRGDHMSELLDYVFSKDMNAWLDLIDAPFAYRLPEAESEQEPEALSVEQNPSNTFLPPPVATGAVAHAFDGLRKWNEKAWKDNLGSPAKWLEACIALRGQRGIREHHWNPVLIGAALVRDGHAKPNNIRAKFQTKRQLEDWKEAWKTYEAENFDT